MRWHGWSGQLQVGCSLSPDEPSLTWLVLFAGVLINLYEIGKDGKVPYQRLRGRKLRAEALEFGECIHYLPLDRNEIGKLESRYAEGVYLGICLEDSSKYVGTPEGVFKTRSVARRPENQRWSLETIKGMTGVP